MRTKVVVLGLDAADLGVMRPMLDAGEMPNMARLMADGASGVLHSTIPPVSAPAWASFLTGRNPGKHGLYSFVVEREHRGRMQLANVTDIRAPLLWDLAALQGARPIVVNIPVTWPAPAFDGMLVTGMLTPESEDVVFTHPPELSAEIRERFPDYRIDIDRALMEDRERLYPQMAEMERRRAQLMIHLLRTKPWDVFVGVFTNTDRVQHSFWRADPRLVREHFRQIDGHIGEIVAELDLRTTAVMLMSDHGFQDSRYKIYVNRALQDAGLLETARASKLDEAYDSRRPDFFIGFQGGRGEKPHDAGLLGRLLAAAGVGGEVTLDWSRTRAFMWSLDTGGVAVNLRSRYPQGTVPDDDYEEVRAEVIDCMKALRLPDGRPAFTNVRRREEVYQGPFVATAPDVIAEPDDTVSFGIHLDAKEAVREHKRPEGHHSPRGFVSITGPGFRRGAKIEGHIVDCLPTILHTAGLAVPEGCDGRVLQEAYEHEQTVLRMPDPQSHATESGSKPYSTEEEEGLRRSLEGLGYL